MILSYRDATVTVSMEIHIILALSSQIKHTTYLLLSRYIVHEQLSKVSVAYLICIWFVRPFFFFSI